MARLRDPQRRTLILETAMELFSQSGFHAVSVKDIAEVSGISLGSMYTYFASKEQLVNELYRQWKGTFGEYVTAGVSQLRGREAHRVLWHNLGRFIKDHPKSFLFLEAQHHATYLDQESVALEVSINQFAVQFYLERLELGLTAPKAQLVIAASFGAFVQVFKASQIGRVPLNDDSLSQLEKLTWHLATGA